MSDNGLVWEEPPFAHVRKAKWLPMLEALQKRPGEWAVLYEQVPDETEIQARNKAVGIKNVAGRHAIKVEVAARTVNGHVKVYGRVP